MVASDGVCYREKKHIYMRNVPIYSFSKTFQEQEILRWLRAGCINVLCEAVKLWLELFLYDLHKSCSVHTLWCLLAEHVQFNTPRGTWASSIYPWALREMMNLLQGESEWISTNSDQRREDIDRHQGTQPLPLFNPRWMIYSRCVSWINTIITLHVTGDTVDPTLQHEHVYIHRWKYIHRWTHKLTLIYVINKFSKLEYFHTIKVH